MAKATSANERLSPSQAARLLGVSTQHLRWMGDRQLIAYEPTPLGRLYERKEVERVRKERGGQAA